MNYIDIKDLKERDVVDKEYLIKMFSRHWTLKYIYEKWYKLKSRNKKRLVIWNVANFFKKINNPLDLEWKNKLLNLFKTRNYIFKKHKKKSTLLLQLKILKTFSFAPYLIIWFIITLLFQNQMISSIVKYSFNIIKTFY
jgi:hypothetical protein